jgi:peptidoglycan-associated lipoprotein
MGTNEHRMTVAVGLGLMIGAGCAHARVAPDAASSSDTIRTDSASKQQIQASATPAQADATAEDQQAQKDLEAAVADLKNTRVFFGFNEDTLTAEGRGKLATMGDILARHAKLKVRIQGNCDERGTEAYNLVLGQRRADVARKYILSMGVKSGQVDTISYGKERPLADGHTEQAWKQNRRDEVVVEGARN